MFRDDTYRFKISISDIPYPVKPDRDSSEMHSMTFTRQEMTVNDLVSAIEMGYAFCYVFDGIKFHIRFKTGEHFRYTKVIAFDIDDVECDMDTALERCSLTPTFAYPTYGNGDNGKCSFRFVYIFDSYINALNFDEVYSTIARVNGFQGLDKRSKEQLYFGTDKEGFFVSNLIYSLSDINVGEAGFYKTHSDLIPSEDGSYFLFPSPYYEVKRLWYYDAETGRRFIRKYTDEGTLSRRTQLYLDGQLLKKINNIVDKKHMLKVLETELFLYYDNSVDPITDADLKRIVENIFSHSFSFRDAEHPSFRVNVPWYKQVLGQDYKPMTAINMTRKKIQLDMFKKLYNPELSNKDNMELFKENNFNISRRTFYYYKNSANQNIKGKAHTNVIYTDLH